MTIREITEEGIEQTCDICERVRQFSLDDITVGMVTEEQINDTVIPLPKCDNCGSVEYLIPSKEDAPEHPSPGSFGHLHAILVDLLHEQLVNQGRLIQELTPDKLKKKKRTNEEIERWFKDGLRLRER